MATDSDIKLTKFKSTVTVVTADFANSIFGGLYGSSEAEFLDEEDARVRGHIHDGEHGDGRAPKVHLVHHVTDQLTNPNLGDEAVTKRNVYHTETQGEAIPEYEVEGDKTFYYLDLRHIRADFVFQEDEKEGSPEHKLIRQRDNAWNDTLLDGVGDYEEIEDVWGTDEGFDFVFGSSSLDDLNQDTNGDSRFQFDKSKSALRAGRATAGQWDENNRGSSSVAFGENNTASGVSSGVGSGSGNTASGPRSVVSGGGSNTAVGDNSGVNAGSSNAAAGTNSVVSGGAANNAYGDYSGVGSGVGNTVGTADFDDGNNSGISAGAGNAVTGDNSGVNAGAGNIVEGDYSGVNAGAGNKAEGDYSGVNAGSSNTASGDKSSVGGGEGNIAEGLASFVGGGGNTIDPAIPLSGPNIAAGDYSSVSGGVANTAVGHASFIGGGMGNKAQGHTSLVGGGANNVVEGDASIVVGGDTNATAVGSLFATVGGGANNRIAGSYCAVLGGWHNAVEGEYGSILGGDTNIAKGDRATIGGGGGNQIDGNGSVIAGGVANNLKGLNSSILGGQGNILESSDLATIGGGSGNNVKDADTGTVGGGGGNNVSGTGSTVSGGTLNKIFGKYSTVSGGKDNQSSGSGDFSTIGGGSSNRAESQYSTVSGGQGNKVTETSDFSSIVGGQGHITNTSGWSTIAGGYKSHIVDSDYGTIVGGYKNTVKGSGQNGISSEYSISVGGYASEIYESKRCIIAGVGAGGKISHVYPEGQDFENNQNLTIGVGYMSFIGREIPGTPSDFSGIFGGHTNHIVGGHGDHLTSPSDNYIVGGSDNRIGGTKASAFGCQIVGGHNNEMVTFGGSDPNKGLYHGLIVGGSDNSILMSDHGKHPDTGAQLPGCSNILYSGIFGGYSNNINHIQTQGEQYTHPLERICIAPWFEPDPWTHTPFGGYGVQTSYIFGGTRNTITNADYAGFGGNSLYSAILGGQNNIISSSYGSSILGGGAFVSTEGPAEPPYDMVDEYYSNAIEGGHHSSILNGSSNLVRQYRWPWTYDSGPAWSEKVDANNPLRPWSFPEPVFCVAQGRESYSYLYGQHAYASGGHTYEKFVGQGFPSASNEHKPNILGQWMAHLGSRYDHANDPENDGKAKGVSNQPGTAQASTLTFFGSWNYQEAEIHDDDDNDGIPDWEPSNGQYFTFRAYLDGGRDVGLPVSESNRCFIPRFPGSYSFTINGSISYTDCRANEAHDHQMISFTYMGYIAVNPDGTGRYGGRLINIISSGGHTLSLIDDPIPNTDFSIAFGPDNLSPENIYNGGTYTAGPTNHFYGPGTHDWYEASNLWNDEIPPKFSICVVNNSGQTGHKLVGESLVARADVVENILFLGKYDSDPTIPVAEES
jgi:hypothetical protein